MVEPRAIRFASLGLRVVCFKGHGLAWINGYVFGGAIFVLEWHVEQLQRFIEIKAAKLVPQSHHEYLPTPSK